MKLITALFAFVLIAGCSSTMHYRDQKGYVMDHNSTVERGGVGNYLFHRDYGDKFKEKPVAAEAKTDEDTWTNYQSSPMWEPSAELVGNRIQISDEIRFKPGSATLTESSKRVLDDVAAVMLNNENDLRSVEIAGHTDSTGSPQRNQILSERRAEVVKAYLVSKGVPEDKLVAVGYGDSDPKFDPANSDPSEIAQNRRVEFKAEMKQMAE